MIAVAFPCLGIWLRVSAWSALELGAGIDGVLCAGAIGVGFVGLSALIALAAVRALKGTLLGAN
jgi:hypothetical protein